MSVSIAIRPERDELYSQFVPRAHGALMEQVPDPDRRNKLVWDSWARVHGDPLGDRANEYFDSKHYKTVPNVCYFYEHSTIGSDGLPVRYSLKELSDIVDEHNARADTDSYSAIASKHTMRGPVHESMEPRVLGFAGPYRLGMVGTVEPKFAVFADEHHLRSEEQTLARKKRRSVEVNRFKSGRRPFFDPIAALGAEAPRLALPVARYSADEDPDVERYEFSSAPSALSGSNTFIPTSEPTKDRHALSEQPSMNADPNTPDQDSLIRQIVQAFMSTPQMQFVNSLMESQAGQGGSQPSQPQPQGPQGGPSMGGMPPSGDDQSGMGFGAGPGAPEMPKQNYSLVDGEGPTVDRYAQLEADYSELSDRYSQLEAANEANMRQFGQMRAAVVQLEQRAVDADRTMKIKDLYQLYPHFIEPEAEMEACLYSHGNDMDSEAFAKHCERLEVYAKRSSPVTTMLPGGKVNEKTVDQYSEQDADRVIERYQQLADRGIVKSFAEVEEMLRKGE